MSSAGDLEVLEADARYYHDRVALLRARLYRWGLGSNARLEDLERQLESAEQRVEAQRVRKSTDPPATLLASGRRRRPRGSLLGSRSQRFGSAIASRTVRGPQRRQGVMHVNAVLRRSRRIARRRQHACPAGHHPAVRRFRTAVIGDVLAGRDVLVKSPTGSGKTLAFGIPLVERIEADGAAPAALDPRADARARDPDRRGHPRRSPMRARCASRGLRRRRPRQAGARRRPLAHPRRDPGTPRGSARPRRVHARHDPDPGARRGRPDARHGLSAGRRPHRRACAPTAPDAVLLGHPRRRGRAHRAASTPSDAALHEHGPSGAPSERRRRASLRPDRRRASRRGARSQSCARARARRWCSCGPSAVPTGSSSGWTATASTPLAMHGNKSQRQRETALAAVRVRPRSTRSSPPTSPRAGST